MLVKSDTFVTGTLSNGIKNITVASDFQTKAFGKAHGTVIDSGILKGIEIRVIFIRVASSF